MAVKSSGWLGPLQRFGEKLGRDIDGARESWERDDPNDPNAPTEKEPEETNKERILREAEEEKQARAVDPVEAEEPKNSMRTRAETPSESAVTTAEGKDKTSDLVMSLPGAGGFLGAIEGLFSGFGFTTDTIEMHARSVFDKITRTAINDPSFSNNPATVTRDIQKLVKNMVDEGEISFDSPEEQQAFMSSISDIVHSEDTDLINGWRQLSSELRERASELGVTFSLRHEKDLEMLDKQTAGNIEYGEPVEITAENRQSLAWSQELSVYSIENGDLNLINGNEDPGSLQKTLGEEFKLQTVNVDGETIAFFAEVEEGKGFYLGPDALDYDGTDPDVIAELSKPVEPDPNQQAPQQQLAASSAPTMGGNS